MAYEQKISQATPGLIGLILDDSASMGDNLGTADPKYLWVERYFGIILHQLVTLSSDVKGNDAVIKPRYFLTVVKYGSYPELWGSPEMDIEAALKLFTQSGKSLGLGGKLQGTDTEAAFAEMLGHLENSLAGGRFQNSFPPMLFHISDGESQTDATEKAKKIRALSTNDGNVLLANSYIGARTSLSYKGPEDFPGYLDVSEAGPDEYNIRLFEMSSQAPASIEANLKADGIFPQIRSGSRLFFDIRMKDMLKHAIQVVSSIGSRMAR